MSDPARLAAQLAQIAVELGWKPPQRGWMDQFRRGRVLILSQAAKIADVTNETVRRWCEQTETDRPVGLLIGSLWLVDLDLNVERAAG